MLCAKAQARMNRYSTMYVGACIESSEDEKALDKT